MSLTPSNMMPLGTKAPAFKLKDVITGIDLTFEDISGSKGTLVMFICAHCPYVIHVQDKLTAIVNNYLELGIGAVAISSNDIDKYPADSPEKMEEQATSVGFQFPYLYDEKQQVALDYQAACTPDIYLFDAEGTCYYRGRMDAATPGNNEPNDGQELISAMDRLLEGSTSPKEQLPSMGCNIKWKPENVTKVTGNHT